MIEAKLNQLGIVLPTPPKPAGSYIPVVQTGNLVFVSGQIPLIQGKVAHTGKVNDENVEESFTSAKLCAINILAQLKEYLGDLEKITKIVRISGFVNCDPGFTQHPKVINAASDMLYEIFGEKAKHTRIAIGVSSLPLDAMTEIDAIVEVRN